MDVKGDLLQDALAGYFENSEQLPTRLWLACTEKEAAGFMLQQLPVEGKDRDDRIDDWQRVNILADTIEQNELFEKETRQLLHQVFAEDDVRVFDSEALRFECGCSRERTAGLIAGIGYEEAIDILKKEGQIEITCEFCNSVNTFDSIDVEAIFRGAGNEGDQETVH